MPDLQSNVAPPSDAPVPGVSPGLKTTRIDAIEESAFVLDWVQKSQAYRQPFIPVWNEVRDNFMVVPFGRMPLGGLDEVLGVVLRTAEARSRLKDPETHQIISTLTDQAMLLLVGALDYIRATPYGPDDPEKARMVQRLLQAYLDSPGQYRTNRGIFQNAFLYGTSYIEIGWQHLARMQPVRRPMLDPSSGMMILDPDTGRPMQEVHQEEVIYRDQPLMSEIQIRDAFPDPSGTRIQEDMHGFAKRFRSGILEARRLQGAGTWNDSEAVDRALAKLGGSSGKAMPGYDEEEFPGLDKTIPEKYGMGWGFTFYGEVPFKRTGGQNRIITLWGGERVAGYPIPFIDGNIPVKEVVVNPMGGRHYGISPAEIVRFLQDSADNFLMIFNDAGDLAIRGPLLLGQAFGGDPERVRASLLGDVIKCRNVDAVKPIPRDLGALTFAAQEMSRRILRMRDASGATNPLQAIPGPVEKTATETNELVRMASQRVQSMTDLIRRDVYPWMARTLHSRFRQFLTDDVTVLLKGENFTVSLDDIDFDADIRIVGPQQADSPSMIASKYQQVATVLGTVPPELVEQYPDIFVRWFRDGLLIQDAETIVARAVQTAQIRQAAAQAQEQAQGTQPPRKPGGVAANGTPAAPPGAGLEAAAATSNEGGQ